MGKIIRKIGGDHWWISENVETKEGVVVAFCFDYGERIADYEKKVAKAYPDYFVLEDDSDLWVTDQAQGKISLEELKQIAQEHPTQAIEIVNMKDQSVVAGPGVVDGKSLAYEGGVEDCGPK